MKIKTLIVFTLIALLIVGLIGCTQPTEETSSATGETTEATTTEGSTTTSLAYDMSPLSDKEKNEISEAWLLLKGNALVWDLLQAKYYGMYNGYKVLIVGFESETTKITISDVTFEMSLNVDFPFEIYAYKDGELILLQNAFDDGKLSSDDISMIYEQFMKHEKSIGSIYTAD